jgi:hypothetical protein
MMPVKGILAPNRLGKRNFLIKEGRTDFEGHREYLNAAELEDYRSFNFRQISRAVARVVERHGWWNASNPISSLSPLLWPIKWGSWLARTRTWALSVRDSCVSCSSLSARLDPTRDTVGQHINSARPAKNGHCVDAQDGERCFKGCSRVT